jgi:hypothetical protein
MKMWECTVGSTAPPFWRELATQAIADRKNKIEEIECYGKIYAINVPPVSESGYVNLYGLDITTQKLAEERILRQLAHLTSLSVIDRIISANFDLKLSLAQILTHVTIELGIDAADILINDPNSQLLKYAAERCFHTKVARESVVRLGESYAGRVALDHQIIKIPNLKEEPENVFQLSLIKNEGFTSYYGVPLMI